MGKMEKVILYFSFVFFVIVSVDMKEQPQYIIIPGFDLKDTEREIAGEIVMTRRASTGWTKQKDVTKVICRSRYCGCDVTERDVKKIVTSSLCQC